MFSKRILFPTDFSPDSDAALEMAASLARDWKASLLILHVEVIPLTTGGGELFYVAPDPPTRELQERLSDVVPSDKSIVVEHRLLAGDPAEAIVRVAETENIDLIVMGTHGRRGLARLLMGSVAEAVVRAAPCPVLTMKQPAHAEVASSL